MDMGFCNWLCCGIHSNVRKSDAFAILYNQITHLLGNKSAPRDFIFIVKRTPLVSYDRGYHTHTNVLY